MDSVKLKPRRLAHANIFVSDLERSMLFYNEICGIEEVRREPGISAGFLSNGASHHDVGLMQTSRSARVGLDGHVQIPQGRGHHPGINHFGWEMENEAELVAAYRRMKAAGTAIHRTTDHQIAHSVYLFDPDGNLHEFFADALEDWRSIFNTGREDNVSGPWNPEAAEPSTVAKYSAHPEIRNIPSAVFHPTRIIHAALVARDYARMKHFFIDVAGLTPVAEDAATGMLLLHGAASALDMVLIDSTRASLSPGLHHITFAIAQSAELDEARKESDTRGIRIDREIDTADKRSLFVKDPDGLLIEFTARRRPGRMPSQTGVDRVYLV